MICVLLGSSNQKTRVASIIPLYCRMPESLYQKKRLFYDHLNRALQNSKQDKQLRELILRNAIGKVAPRTPSDEIQRINERLTALEHRIDEMYNRRLAYIEMQMEITVNALAKVIYLYC